MTSSSTFAAALSTVLLMRRSAAGLTVSAEVARSLPVFGSNVNVATEAEFVTEVPAAASCGVAATVIVAVAPAARVPSEQVKVVPAPQVPWRA